MTGEARKSDLTIYLLKDSVEDHKLAFTKQGRLSPTTIKDENGKALGTLYIKRPYSKPPKWASFFDGYIDKAEFGKNASAGALFFVEIQDRFFVLSFGQGRHSLDGQYIEPNFGFRVTLNVVDSSSVRSIDKTSLETHPRHLREQAGRETALQYFGLDVEQDLLRAVTGRPEDKYWGERISGMDSLRLSISIGPSELKPLCLRLLKEFESTAYRSKGFAFVDHIGEVKDQALVQTLDKLLLDKLNRADIEGVWMAAPDVVEWEQAVGFRYSQSSARVYDVRMSAFLQTLNGAEVSKALLQRRRIACVDVDDEVLFERSAYTYIYTEMFHDGRTYLLNNGKWYSVEKDFVDQINQYFDSIPAYIKPLPIYSDKSESDYNARVALEAPDEFVLLDRKNISVSAAVSPVEPCDLYRAGKEFIHIKRYGGSSLFSHLFNQGLVSGELFKRDQKFRELLNEKLPHGHKVANPALTPLASEYKVIYAIVSESNEPLTIPFFSRISLRHAKQRLNDMGFPVELAKIGVKEEVKNLEVLLPKHPKLKKAKTTTTV